MRNLVLAVAWLSLAGAAAAETTVLTHFTLIDGTGRAPVADAALVVTDGRIQWAGPAAQLHAPRGARTVDLRGKYVMPGLINLHAHVGNTVGLAQDPRNYTRANVEAQLKLYASYGVTSVAAMGTDGDLVYQIRAEQRAGRPRMARIFTAGHGFTGVGGYPSTVAGMQGVPFEVATPADVRRDIDLLADQHVDLVKIWVDDHLGRDKKISIDLCRAIIGDAHQHNLKVVAHVFYLADAKALVDAGLNGLAHSVRDRDVDDALIASMKRHRAWQDAATLTREASMFVFAGPNPIVNDPFFTRGVAPDVLRTLRSADYQARTRRDPDFAKYPGFLETAKRNLKRLSDAGVQIGFGTDSGAPGRFPGYFEHWELELMVEAGLTPMQAITDATGHAAEFLGAGADLGTLQPGRWADLMVLSRDPLANIRNTRGIEAVYVAGNKLD